MRLPHHCVHLMTMHQCRAEAVQYLRAFVDVDRTVNFQEREAFEMLHATTLDYSHATQPDIISVRQLPSLKRRFCDLMAE
jgi:hypothetical protein